MTCAVAPTAAGLVASLYGDRPGRTSGRPTFHAGWDFVAPTGTVVRAPWPGIVERVAANADLTTLRGYGNAVVLRHPDLGLWTLYAHLSRAQVLPEQRVLLGQRLGLSGNTTNGRFPGMGPHLHLEVRHVRADGRSPFPGPYRPNAVNPAGFFGYLGLRLGRDALPAPLVRAGDCRPEALAAAVAAGRVELAGLGQPPDEEYEPPAEWFDEPSPWRWIGAVAIALGLASVGVAVGSDER